MAKYKKFKRKNNDLTGKRPKIWKFSNFENLKKILLVGIFQI